MRMSGNVQSSDEALLVATDDYEDELEFSDDDIMLSLDGNSGVSSAGKN